MQDRPSNSTSSAASTTLCNNTTTIGFITFAATWVKNKTYTLTLFWDATNKQIVGTVSGLPRKAQEVQTISYGALTDTDPPGFDFKDLRVQTLVANCTAGSKMARFKATFDDFSAQ